MARQTFTFWFTSVVIFSQCSTAFRRIESINGNIELEHVAETGRSQPFGMGKDSNELALQAVQRACVDDLAEQYENMIKTDFPEILPGNSICGEDGQGTSKDEKNLLECDNLVGLLARRWGTEDELETEKELKTAVKTRLQAIKKMTQGRYFSVKYAKKMCLTRIDEPRPEAVRDCLVDHIDGSSTIKRGMFFGTRKKVSLNISAERAEQLKGHIHKRWELEEQIELLDNVGNFKTWIRRNQTTQEKKNMMDELKTKKKDELEEIKKAIKETKFSYHFTHQRCMKETKDDTLGNSAAVLSRLSHEIKDVVNKDEGKCEENADQYCPEGTVADSRRGFDALLFAKVWVGTFSAYKPVAMGIGALLGFIVGGPAGAAAGAAMGAIPGPGMVVPFPIATAAATDWFPKCRCFPAKCEFDYDLGYCLMTAEEGQKNPFKRLPYPGQRCKLKGRGTDDASKPGGMSYECELAACRHKDFEQHRFPDVGLTGSIGHQAGTFSSNNCLLIPGEDSSQQLLTAMTLPSGIDNSAANRTALYQEMKVELKESHNKEWEVEQQGNFYTEVPAAPGSAASPFDYPLST